MNYPEDHDTNELVPVKHLSQCAACMGSDFQLLYEGVRDALFGAPGSWSFKRCKLCGTIALDPRPTGSGFDLVYTPAYSTRKGVNPSNAVQRRGVLARFRKALQRGVLASSFGYTHAATRGDRLLGALFGWLPGVRGRASDSIMGIGAPAPGSCLLDVGCGVGQFLGTMESLGWKAVGVDTDARVVEAARVAGLDARCGSLGTIGFAESSFDVITMRHVIEHVEDPASMLEQVRRLLKPGGMILMATPNARGAGQAAFGAYWLGLDVSRHMQLFTSQSLAELSRRVGFQRVEVRSSARITRFVATASRAHQRYRINAYRQRVPIAARLFGFGMMAKATWHIAMGRDDGEELVLKAYR